MAAMEMRHLRCLVAVAEELHFGRAARRLNLSQPPVSLAIKELETELGVTLFERSSRRIALTADGEAALADARAVLARTELLKRRAREEAGRGPSRSLSIGFISTAVCSFLPAALKVFMTAFPKVRVVLQESTTDRMLVELGQGTLDIGFLFASPGMAATLSYRSVQREPLIVALPDGHALARLAQVPLERLAQERFIGFERHHGPMMFDSVVATCIRHGFSPQLFPARQMHTIVGLVSAGIGVALVPRSVQVLQRVGVVYRPIRGESVQVETGAAWRPGESSRIEESLLACLPKPGRRMERAAAASR